MSNEEETVMLIRGMISTLPKENQDKCTEIANQIRQLVASDPVGLFALTLVGTETQLAASKIDAN